MTNGHLIFLFVFRLLKRVPMCSCLVALTLRQSTKIYVSNRSVSFGNGARLLFSAVTLLNRLLFILVLRLGPSRAPPRRQSYLDWQVAARPGAELQVCWDPLMALTVNSLPYFYFWYIRIISNTLQRATAIPVLARRRCFEAIVA